MSYLLFLVFSSLLFEVELMKTNDTCEVMNAASVYTHLMTTTKANVFCSPPKQSSVGVLLKEISSLRGESMRKISSVVGAVVADAASVPLQWIYGPADTSGLPPGITPTLHPAARWRVTPAGLQEEGSPATPEGLQGEGSPAFFPTSHSPIFTVPTGASSCYGDAVKLALNILKENKGRLDLGKIQDGIRRFYGAAESPYQVARAKRPEYFSALQPVPGPWLNGCVIRALQNMEDGVDPPGDTSCADTDGFAISLPAFLLHCKPIDAEKTAKIVANTPLTMTHLKVQTRIINNFIKNVPDPVGEVKRWCKFEAMFNDQFHQIVREITDVEEALAVGKSPVEVVAMFGKSCGLPMSFQGSLAFLLSPAPLDRNFSHVVEANIVAGGDCCGRATFIGACLGAKLGIQGIPTEWLDKVDGIQELIKNAIKLYK